jgi:hypothetical protein
MKIPETPEGWQHDRPKAPPAPPSRSTTFLGSFLLTILLGAGVAAYIYIGRDTTLAGAVPLPKALETKSSAHDDLMALGGDLQEIAKDALQRLGFHDAASDTAAVHLRTRLAAVHEKGRRLEPKLSRNETRVLMAFDEAQVAIDDYITASQAGQTNDDDEIRLAERQIANGLALGRGEDMDHVILSALSHRVKTSDSVRDINDIRRVKLRLLDDH